MVACRTKCNVMLHSPTPPAALQRHEDRLRREGFPRHPHRRRPSPGLQPRHPLSLFAPSPAAPRRCRAWSPWPARILEGDLNAIRYYLSTQGRHRGYGERVQHTGEGGPVRLEFVVDVFQTAGAGELIEPGSGGTERP